MPRRALVFFFTFDMTIDQTILDTRLVTDSFKHSLIFTSFALLGEDSHFEYITSLKGLKPPTRYYYYYPDFRFFLVLCSYHFYWELGSLLPATVCADCSSQDLQCRNLRRSINRTPWAWAVSCQCKGFCEKNRMYFS